MVLRTIIFSALSLYASNYINAQSMPPRWQDCIDEPVKYIGTRQTDKHFYDGAVPAAVGVHNYQAYRANRISPPEGGNTGWTYSHAPMLCYWNGRFFLQYLSNLKEEHNPPSRTMLMTSEDGRHWSSPVIVFPVYPLPAIRKNGHLIIPEGTPSVMHQRMGFYVAPNSRLLTVGFYSYCATPRDSPNLGQGLGHVVREIYSDTTFGPVYFIRYNRHAGWDEKNTHFPFYLSSADSGFINACHALLKDKLMTLQWWEMDRSKDGFYTLDPGEQEIKALSYFHRPDGVGVGLWKSNIAALSADEGNSWTPLGRYPSLRTCGAKVWGQRIDDGRYALVYNHSASLRNRFPLVVITGDDGYVFENMLLVDGEVPPMRYQGIHKNVGSQYVRGILEGNGDPPGTEMWVTYSMNKEDIWIARVGVPVRGTVDDHPDQDFERIEQITDLGLWNFHIPNWAQISITKDPYQPGNSVMMMNDWEPYDYALAERVFPLRQKVSVNFRVCQHRIGHGLLEVEVHDENGKRPMRLRFDKNWLMFDRAKGEPRPVPITTETWYRVNLQLDCIRQSYDVLLDDVLIKTDIEFEENVAGLNRLIFRTGPWRGDVRQFILNGEPGNPGLYQEDLPGAGDKMPESVFLIDNVGTADL